MPPNNEPSDTAFLQQRSKTYASDITGYQWSILLLCMGIFFVPLGSMFKTTQSNVYEQIITYDGLSSSSCQISTRNQGKICQLNFTLSEDISGDVYLYYQLSNFYQNHRRYIASRSLQQLQGQNLAEGDVNLDCNPLLKNGTYLLNPCGLVANSFFNDIFKINSALSTGDDLYAMSESGISLPSDRQYMFKQVTGFKYNEIANTNVSCSESGLTSSCKQYCDSNGTCYNYFYPDDSTVQYLYESYPESISPIEGVTNEHFIVWMRTAMLPTFRKLYGFISGPFKQGDTIVIDVTANYEVSSFGGTKSLILTNIGSLGGKNEFMGTMFISSGSLVLGLGVFVGLLEFWMNYKLTSVKMSSD